MYDCNVPRLTFATKHVCTNIYNSNPRLMHSTHISQITPSRTDAFSFLRTPLQVPVQLIHILQHNITQKHRMASYKNTNNTYFITLTQTPYTSCLPNKETITSDNTYTSNITHSIIMSTITNTTK